MKFEFSLKTLLKAKEIKEQQTQKKLSELSKRLESITKAVAKRKEEIEESRREYLNLATSGSLGPSDIELYREHILSLDQTVKNLSREKSMIRQKIEFTRKELMEATMEKKSLEKLKEKERTQFFKKIDEMEAKELDDIAQQRYKPQCG